MFAGPEACPSMHVKYARRAKTARKIRAPREYMRGANNFCARSIKACIKSIHSAYSVSKLHPCLSVFICGAKDS